MNEIMNSQKIQMVGVLANDTVTEPVEVLWVPSRNFTHFLAGVMRLADDNDITLMRVIGNTEEDGSGDSYEIKVKDLTGIQPAALSDHVFVEVTDDDIAAVARENEVQIAGLCLELTIDVQAAEIDGFAVVYVQTGARYQSEGMTVDAVA